MSVFDDEEQEPARVSTTVRLERTLLDWLDKVAEDETARRKATNKRAAGLSRNDVIERLLKHARKTIEAEEQKSKKR